MGLKLDLACGARCTPGHEGVDIAPCEGAQLGDGSGRHPDVKHVHNLLDFPWPFEDGSVDAIVCKHFVEHIPMLFWTSPNSLRTDEEYTKAQNEQDGFEDSLSPVQVSEESIDLFLKFFDECYRILAPGGELKVETPQAHSNRAFQDPSHRRFLVPESYLYLDREWRRQNGLEHAAYAVECDFPISLGFIQHNFLDANNVQRYTEAANAARVRHEWNFAMDLHATLKKRPAEVPQPKSAAVPVGAGNERGAVPHGGL